MKEDFIYYLWENRLLSRDLSTVDGRKVDVVSTGYRNTDSGPDFLDARVKIDDALWAGNVEIHVLASDWFRHQHQRDEAYANVVLHVVYEYDTEKVHLPTLVVKDSFDVNIYEHYTQFVRSQRWISCEFSLSQVQGFTWISLLDRMAVEKLELQCEAVLERLKRTRYDWEEVFYQRYMRYLGLKINNEAFDMLSLALPLRTLLKHSDNVMQTEAVLFGTAGLLSQGFSDYYPMLLKREYEVLRSKFNLVSMSSSQWKYLRLRPVNFPTIRLSQAAMLIHRRGAFFSDVRECRTLEELKALFDVKASGYWNTHYCFDKLSPDSPKIIGESATNILIENAVIPLLFCYARTYEDDELRERALTFFEELEPENNIIIRKFAERGVTVTNALQSQGLLHLFSNYCRKKRCLECRIFYCVTK